MKKKAFLLAGSVILTAFIIFACNKKEHSDAISPTFESTGNPHPGEQTVTGSSTYSNPATQNSAINAQGPGWSNPTCGSTNSVTLKSVNLTTDVTLSFAKTIQTGTYAIATIPSGYTSCALTIVNAPDQPTGIIWYGKSGVVSVTTSSNAITANFNNIICTQKNFNFPTVTASGVIGCSQ